MQNQWHNKEKKIEYLKRYTRERSEGMLFIYGPKSSGKTTLPYKSVPLSVCSGTNCC
tara:strand:+ start:157 stop:327 length:171 start_codon:yes stop_codon:yes gene_type:complete